MAVIDLPGSPGSKPVGLNLKRYPEIQRLLIYAMDLEDTIELLGHASRDDRTSQELDAYCLAALIKFLGCFDSTNGARKKPLRTKRYIEADDRDKYSEIRAIRNRVAVHDEGLYPLESIVAVVTPSGEVEHVTGFKGTMPLREIGGLLQLLNDLAPKVFDRVKRDLNAAFDAAKNELNEAGPEVVAELLAAKPFALKIENEEPAKAKYRAPRAK